MSSEIFRRGGLPANQLPFLELLVREMGDQFGEYEAASMHSPLLSIVVNGMLTGCRGLILAISIQIVPDRTSRYPVHAKGLIRFRKVLYRTLVTPPIQRACSPTPLRDNYICRPTGMSAGPTAAPATAFIHTPSPPESQAATIPRRLTPSGFTRPATWPLSA